MKLFGCRTRAMFDRDDIIDEIDLAQAVAKRCNWKSSPPATTEAPLSSSPAISAA